MTTISFPGLGIGEFQINPVAIPIGDGGVRWYGILIAIGMILAFFYCAYRAKYEGISFDDLIDIAIFTFIFAIVGARSYYVLTSLDQYDSFWDIFKIWNGGLAIYGGIIAGAITIFAVCKFKKYSLNKIIKFFDAVAPAVMIGQIIGRWGNFCNGEAYGALVSENSPLYFIRMGLISHNTVFDFNTASMVYVHPTFLYESLWNLVGFILIHCLYKKKKFDGQNVLMYLTWYGFGRMFIEGLRTDSLYVGVFRISQVVGFLCFTIGGIALIFNLVRASRKKKDATEYAPAYKKISRPAAIFDNEGMDVESDSENIDTSDAENNNDKGDKDDGTVD